ncbi:ATP phosphoribosyltransferase regulatory subunit [Lysinibacillus sp. 2017]|uniref:ATP phosphoribosyltransferase regulatory subunit n=1 Tax=unclassified Lysinibacillus TaxID=2636778 RepID=UPI000D529BED|nr:MULTISPECIES: ATP phosphoribosyltransferase regulatory subunit [unclassified Lysinibacillus]AWE08638.1 ATP phosphoribosyltransferase regulatory subunit [Lysinibacillus sp. 2017]TGN35059.1 ATP phosphoribosyltransferase regulatory subunit [Lysinibacillus sp. S2017]
MSSIKMFEKPLGMRDTFPNIYEKLELIRSTGRDLLRARGYEFIKTPSVEYYDTIGKASAISDARLFKLVDSQGNTLVLRPDMTTPIARVATSKLLKEKIPQRLAYFANVFRAQQREGGRPAEFDQMGIELIGDTSVFADAEVIMTAIDLVKAYNITDFKVTIGHAGVLSCILKDYTESTEQAAQLNELLVQRNFVGFEEAVINFDLPKTKSNALLAYIEEAISFPSIETVEKYVRKNDALEYMRNLAEILDAAGYERYIAFDFTLASHMSYYTGMLFEVFASGSGFPLGNGGRYDGLLTHFGSNFGATGFGLRVDRVFEAMPKIEVESDEVLVLFVADRFSDALMQANFLREQGKQVTFQAYDGIENVDALKAQFKVVNEFQQGEA